MSRSKLSKSSPAAPNAKPFAWRSRGPRSRKTENSSELPGTALTSAADPSELPLLSALKVRSLYRIIVQWRDGPEEVEVDLAPHILRYAIYRPLRDDFGAFRQAEIVDGGVAIAWPSYDIDVSADTVAALARVQRMSAEEFRGRLDRWGLSFDAAASALAISRRQIAYFAAGAKPIPRYVILALRGFEVALAGTNRLEPSFSLSSFKSSELLSLHGRLIEELRSRNVVRSTNNPTDDLAEYLFCRAFGWSQAGNSQAGFDAIEPKEGTRFQIKGRRTTRHNASRQLSAIRELGSKKFD